MIGNLSLRLPQIVTAAVILVACAPSLIVRSQGSDLCFNEHWHYSLESGACYRPNRAMTSIKNAYTFCKNKLKKKFPSLTVHLNQMSRLETIVGFRRVLEKVANKETQWIDAFFNVHKEVWERWSDEKKVITLDHIDIRGSPKDGSCLVYKYDSNFNSDIEIRHVVYGMRANCTERHSYTCEYATPRCDVDNVPGLVKSTMQLEPRHGHIGQVAKIACRPGHYRKYEIEQLRKFGGMHVGAVVAGSGGAGTGSSASGANRLPPFHVNCTVTPHPDRDPSKMRVQWVAADAGNIDMTCQMVGCLQFNSTVKNVVEQPRFDKRSKYNAIYAVECRKGYVNYQDYGKTSSAMKCDQNPDALDKGIWTPTDNMPCIGYPCNFYEMAGMRPENSYLDNVRNRHSEEVLSRDQVARYAHYENIVTFRCNNGLFFPDRQPVKRIMCDLPSKPGQKYGEWRGYLETVLPLPQKCVGASCKYEQVKMSAKLRLRKKFHVLFPNNTLVSRSTHDKEPYSYGVVLRFFCKNGYDTAKSATSQNLTCNSDGQWTPNLTPCIYKTRKLYTGKRKHYVPPPVDAPQAKQVGAVIIIILVLFISLIILLDLSAITRDFKILKHNIKFLKRRLKMNKLMAAKELETKMSDMAAIAQSAHQGFNNFAMN